MTYVSQVDRQLKLGYCCIAIAIVIISSYNTYNVDVYGPVTLRSQL